MPEPRPADAPANLERQSFSPVGVASGDGFVRWAGDLVGVHGHEAVEGRDAFLEKRDSDCGRFPAILLIYREQFPPNRINADLNQATHSPPRVR
jgi:hypothetical protein